MQEVKIICKSIVNPTEIITFAMQKGLLISNIFCWDKKPRGKPFGYFCAKNFGISQKWTTFVREVVVAHLIPQSPPYYKVCNFMRGMLLRASFFVFDTKKCRGL